MRIVRLLIPVMLLLGTATRHASAQNTGNPIKVGAYYYDGWGGKNAKANDPNEPWAKNAPRQVTKRMLDEFADREPLWGWRSDSQEIMERQIDLAADNGVEFFLFCWYWRDTQGPINLDRIAKLPGHESMHRYLKAKNKHRIKFGLLIANHQGAEITGTENWKVATEHWMQYFNDPQYIKVDNKPLVVIFSAKGIENGDLAGMQEVSQKQGLAGLTIAGCGNTAGKNFDVRTHYNVVPGYSGGPEEHKYSELANAQRKQWQGTKEQPYIPTVIAGWDKRPWEDPSGNGKGGAKQGWYYTDRSPAQFKSLLKDAVDWMDVHPEQTAQERLMLIYAWNELGEGGYLVPTKGDPKASYLKTVKEVVAEQNKKVK
ncbi:glycoside hydrolase family 99-like domain-containing protein [Dyadobacter sp. 32]|uniref:glycoside hydrolase family 99-like domain-containing protein n=1 Tax=Dyadobacter sp. 32 TaxID=538966 RepID=UPI0039C62868